MRPIKCNEVQSSIMDCIERELPTSDVLAHLASCDRCQEEYSDYHFILKKFRNFEVKEPDDTFWENFPTKVLAQVNEVKIALAPDIDHANHFELTDPDKSSSRGGNGKFNDDDKSNIIPFVQTDSLSHQQPGYKQTTKMVRSSFFSSSITKIFFPIAATILVAVGIVGYLGNESALPAVHYSHDILAFQVQINKITPVSTLARQLPTNEPAMNAWYSFSAQPTKANPFFVGAKYAEIVALSGDGDKRAGNENMTQLRHELLKNRISDKLDISAEQTENMLASKDTIQKNRVQALSNFELNYRKYLITDIGDDALVYFQLGGWVVNMSLAALAESSILKKEKLNVKYFSEALFRLSAPSGVRAILDDIDKLINKSELTKKDYQGIYSLSLKLRTQLS